MIRYSVIIPFRGDSSLLEKSISTIPERDDIQVIVVDNNEKPVGADKVTPDRCVRPMYLTSDPCAGAGRARNVGLEHADAPKILFMDADDRFAPGAFDVFDKYADAAYDIVYFNSTSIRLSDGMPSSRHLRMDAIVRQCLADGNDELIRYDFQWPCCKLYSSTFLKSNGLRFEEVRCSNDVMFSVMSGHLAVRIHVDGSVVYVITEGPKNSSLTTTRSRENMFVRYKVAIEQNAFYRECGKPYLQKRLLPYIGRAFATSGFVELMRYLRYACVTHSNIFTGYLNRKYKI